MKKIAALVLALLIGLPFTAAAQSADDIILNLLSSLDGPGPVQTTSTVTATVTPTVAPKPKPSATPAAPQQEVLTPFHLFDLDGNAPKADPQIGTLKSQLQALLAQFASLSAGTTPQAVSTSTAATSTASSTPKSYLRDLTIGSKGNDVKALQSYLIKHGYLFGDVTGYFGILTKTALSTFQSDRGLPPVGNFGPLTRTLLNKLLVDSLKEQSAPDVAVPLPLGPAPIPFTASSTSASLPHATSTISASSTAGTSTVPLPFDPIAAITKPVAVSLSILPTEAPVGGSVSVTWLSQNATSCAASDGWDGPKPTIGAAIIQPLQFSLNFVLTCTGAGGVASTSALVVVGGEQ